MPKREFNGAIYFRCDAQTDATLRDIMRDQKMVPVDLAKGLLEEACKFYRENGYFYFPIVFEPRHQLMVAEPQADYDAKGPAITGVDLGPLHSSAPDEKPKASPKRLPRRK